MNIFIFEFILSIHMQIMSHIGDGEITQWQHALVCLTEDTGLVPSTQIRQLRTTCNSDSVRFYALIWPPQALQTCVADRHVHIYINKNKYF